MGLVLSKSHKGNNDDIQSPHLRELKNIFSLKQKFNICLFSEHPIITETLAHQTSPSQVSLPLSHFLSFSTSVMPEEY